jgi:hypothetical protein
MSVPCIIKRSRKNQHNAHICTTALFHMLTPTCFGSSLPSSGSFWIRLSYMKNTDRYGGLSYNVVKWPVCRSAEVQSVVLPSWVHYTLTKHNGMDTLRVKFSFTFTQFSDISRKSGVILGTPKIFGWQGRNLLIQKINGNAVKGTKGEYRYNSIQSVPRRQMGVGGQRKFRSYYHWQIAQIPMEQKDGWTKRAVWTDVKRKKFFARHRDSNPRTVWPVSSY